MRWLVLGPLVLVVVLVGMVIVAPMTRPPASVAVDGDSLVVKARGPYRVLAIWAGPVVPLAHVRSARAVPDARPLLRGPRVGTYVPGGSIAGSFGVGARRAYWVVERKAAVVIELTGERFATLVLEVEEPEATAAMIEQALARSEK